MNKFIGIGRISSDLNLRYTPSNNAVCEFNLAINRMGTDGTDFLTCVVWNKQAENLVKYQSKGNLISVEGSNRVDRFQNKEGENRYKHYILVNNIQFLESKKESNEAEKKEVDPFEFFGDKIEISEDELPFN